MIQNLLNKFISYCINNEINDKSNDNLVNISNKNSTNDTLNNENDNLLSEPILNTNSNSDNLQCIHGRYNFMEPCELCSKTLKNNKKFLLKYIKNK